MSRTLLAALFVLLCAAMAMAPGEAAKAAPTSCTVTSAKIESGTVTGKLTSSNVDPVQARFATCEYTKKVMSRAIALGVEEPRPVRGFYCRPTVSPSDDDKVSYICTFRGADTATFIKLTFQVTYKS